MEQNEVFTYILRHFLKYRILKKPPTDFSLTNNFYINIFLYKIIYTYNHLYKKCVLFILKLLCHFYKEFFQYIYISIYIYKEKKHSIAEYFFLLKKIKKRKKLSKSLR